MNNPFGIDFGALGDAMEDLQDAYSGGLGAMNQAGQQVAEDMSPSHRIVVDVELLANIEGHQYKVDSQIEFLADLESILKAQGGDIASLLSGLGADLSKEEQKQVAEQLGKPRCIAVVDKISTKKLELYSEDGKEDAELNKKGTMLITLDNEKLSFSFESVLAFPELQAQKTIYCAIPSQEKMQENLLMNADDLGQEIDFEWQEKDKDNLKVKGKLKVVSV